MFRVVLTCGIITVYVATGIASGALASRIAYRRTRPSKKEDYAKMWGWLTFFLWPFTGLGFGLWGLGYGLYRILNRVLLPAEAR
jgi:hypothetical protein